MLSYLLAGATVGPVVSQTFLDLMMIFIFICFAKEMIKDKFQNFSPLRKPYLFEYGIIFYVIAIVTGLLILGITDSEAWIRLYRFYWIPNLYLLIWAFSRYEIDLTKLIKLFTWGFIAPNAYAIFTTFYGYDFIRQHPSLSFRLTGLLDSATYHAHANGLVFMFFLTLLFFQFQKLSRFYKGLSIIAVTLMFLGIFMTFTRGIWLSLTLTALIFLFFQHRKLFIISIVSGLVFLATIYTTSENFRSRVDHSMKTKTTDQQRWSLLKVHLLMIEKAPFIGIGYANSLSHTPPETWSSYGFEFDPSNHINSHAHNQFLNVFATTGLFGLIPFILFYFWFLFTNLKLVKKFKEEKLTNYYILSMACLMAQIEFTIANLTDVGFEYTKIRAIILLVWALVFCMWQNRLKISQTATAQN